MLEKMCIFHYRYSVTCISISQACYIQILCHHADFPLLDLLIIERNSLKSPAIILGLPVFLCSSASFCFIYYEAMLLCAYKFKFVLYSRYHFVLMSFFRNSFCLKSVVDINMAKSCLG